MRSMKMKRLIPLCLAGLGALAFAWSEQPQSSAVAQSGSRSRGGTAQSFTARFWDYLVQVHYENWAPAPGQGLQAYPGQSPHGAFLKMYLNRIAAADPKNLPPGSIIIKENYGKDKTTLMAVTVMYRVKGFDPQHYDWYWVKYNADGTVAQTPPEKGSMPIAGRFQSCIQCHAGAKGGDFVFMNDK